MTDHPGDETTSRAPWIERGGDGWRGYWPPERRNPLLRLAVAMLLGPGLMAAALTLVWALGSPLFPGVPFDMSRDTPELFHDSVEVFYRAALIWFVPTIALLYILRLRSRRAFGICALVAAVLEVGLVALSGDEPRLSTFLSACVLYGLMFLALRSMAGIRSLPGDW